MNRCKVIDTSFFFQTFLMMALLCLMSATAIAQPVPAESPCDPNYYDSLESRAWMEAQREITQNQNLIFKPDSVFEYTCFDRHMNVLAQQAENMFSESSRWGRVLPANSMDNALQGLVGSALQTYINLNFEQTSSGTTYDLLGGRMDGTDHDPQAVSGGAYSCDIMNKVWMAAKCMSFVDEAEEDGFFTFAEYAADPDKRFLPERCPSISGRWNTEISQAVIESGTPWTEDTTDTFLERLYPATCGLRNHRFAPIATGVIIARAQETPRFYYEKLCIAPGCHYVPSGNGTPDNPSNEGACVPN